MKNTLLSIVIPAYNEEKTLEELVNRVLKVKFPEDIDTEIIIVNDGSQDNTGKIAKSLDKKHKNIKAFDNAENSGKSQTVRNGLLKTKGDIVVIQDADFEYDPNELVDLLNLMRENNLEVVYGNRFGKKNKVIYWQNYIGNKFLSLVSNVFTYPRIGVWLPDMEVCYKMIKGDIARKLGEEIVSTTMFGLEPEITAKLSQYTIEKRRLKFGVVPISYLPRSIKEGKKMKAFNDGFKAIVEIIKFNLLN